jgi:chromosome segregation ATPase
MGTTGTESVETPLAKARRTFAETECVVRDEQTVLATFQAKDRQLAQDTQRLQATMQQADDLRTIRATQERQAAVEHDRTELGKDIAAQELVIAKRRATVTAATADIEAIRNQAIRLRQQIARDDADARQLERDIAKTEADAAGWRPGLAGLRQRIATATRALQELGA